MNRVDPDRDLRQALSELSRLNAESPMPDMSRSIMGRLGYMRVGSAVARRRRMHKWAGRAGVLFVAATALALGWRVFEASPQVRRPVDTTIPQAIRHDVEQQQQRFGSMIQTIREISAPRLAPQAQQGQSSGRPTPSVQPAPGGMDAPFSAEQHSHPAIGAPSDSVPAPDQSPNGQEMREDVNRTSRSPVRWV